MSAQQMLGLCATQDELTNMRCQLALDRAAQNTSTGPPPPKPVGASDRSSNILRPTTFDGMTGQDKPKRMLRRVVERARTSREPLDHVLLVAASGTGKSTFSHVIACELGVDVYEVEAPVSHETLLQLREVMQDRDILRIEEIHMQAHPGRGVGVSTPEVLYSIMEDRTLTSGHGILPFPAITIIGTTTDEGQLSDPFVNRFPLRPMLEPYTHAQLRDLAGHNAVALGMTPYTDALDLFAGASRGVPRQINNYAKNARSLVGSDGFLTRALAEEVVFDLNGCTADGLTTDMASMLTFLYTRGRHETAEGEVRYQAGLSTIATGVGKSRDTKAIVLRTEPFLIQRGFIAIAPGGRRLTDAGIQRAEELLR